jgi:hypothetical protein
MPASRRALPILLLLALGATRAGATGGAWNLLTDGYFFRLGLSSLSASQEYERTGRSRLIFSDSSIYSNGSYGVTDISLYGELGITDWLTAVASTQYKVAVRQAENSATRHDTTASASGLSDLWLDGRIRLLPREMPYAATVTVGVKLPTGSPYQQLPLGSGVVDYEASLAVGRAFPVVGLDGYAQLSGGYRLRNNAANELSYLMEFGVNLNESIVVQGIIEGVHSTADFDAPAPDGSGVAGTLVFDQSYLRWKLTTMLVIRDGLDLDVGYGAYASGRNAAAGHMLSVGLAWIR